MSDRLIFGHETQGELDFDTAGRPLHCGQRMQDDYDMHSCTRCPRYIRTALMIDVRNNRGIKRTY